MIDLFERIKLSKNTDTPLYMQLYKKIKQLINEDILLPGTRLPSIRRLAKTLQVNQVTIVSAVKCLENEGYLYSRPGSGIYVTNTLPIISNIPQQEIEFIQDELYYEEDILLMNNSEIRITEKTINFASATPTTDLFPVEDFKLALNEVLDRDRGSAFGYQESQGYYPLRESIQQFLQKQGVVCNPANIQIISGAQQGIDIISKVLLRKGDNVIVESPTYMGAVAVFKTREAEIIGVEMSENGPDMNVLEYNIRKFKPRLIYTIPTFQNPTGYSYSAAKREELLKLAEKYNCYIIEDDYISDLDFENRQYPRLKAIDKYGRVIFIKSFSKIFMPGLRLGFMIVPSGVQKNILSAKHTTDISTSGLIQRAFDLYIRKGYWSSHLKYMYEIYKKRYVKTVTSLDKFLPGNIKYIKPGGGLNIWLNLPYGSHINKLLKAAASKNIIFAPGKIFYNDGPLHKLDSIRLSFASVHVGRIEEGVKKLCEIIK